MDCCCAITRYHEGRQYQCISSRRGIDFAPTLPLRAGKGEASRPSIPRSLLGLTTTRPLQLATAHLRRIASSRHITSAISFRRFALCLAAVWVATLAVRNTSTSLFGSLVRGPALSHVSRITSVRNMSGSTALKKESVWDYPRPPALEPTSRHLRVVYTDPTSKEEIVLADTKSAFRVLETRFVVDLF